MPFVLLVLAGVSYPPQDAADLTDAMNVPIGDLQDAAVSGHDAMSDPIAELGVILPTAGNEMAALSSGQVGAAGNDPGTDWGNDGTPAEDQATLTLELHSPPWATSMSYDFFFLSAEYPVWVGSQYNDTFVAQVGGSLWSGNAALDAQGNEITVNSVLFDVTDPADLAGTGFKGHGGTGWLINQIPVEPDSAVTITFDIQDLGDGILDSTVVLDNFRWSTDFIVAPKIIEPLELDFLSPKRGSVAGYETTIIYGELFEESCTAWLDTIQVPTVFLDSEHLEITTPPHPAGQVDVQVDCGGAMRDTLRRGFTFYDKDNGDLGPSISTLLPYSISVDGGEQVTLVGKGFTEHTRVAVDQELVTSTFVDEYTITFESPPHAPGLAAVSVKGHDLRDRRAAALLYVGEPGEEWERLDSRSGVDDSRGCQTAGGGWSLGRIFSRR